VFLNFCKGHISFARKTKYIPERIRWILHVRKQQR